MEKEIINLVKKLTEEDKFKSVYILLKDVDNYLDIRNYFTEKIRYEDEYNKIIELIGEDVTLCIHLVKCIHNTDNGAYGTDTSVDWYINRITTDKENIRLSKRIKGLYRNKPELKKEVINFLKEFIEDEFYSRHILMVTLRERFNMKFINADNKTEFKYEYLGQNIYKVVGAVDENRFTCYIVIEELKDGYKIVEIKERD